MEMQESSFSICRRALLQDVTLIDVLSTTLLHQNAKFIKEDHDMHPRPIHLAEFHV